MTGSDFILGPDGPFTAALENFRVRIQQQEMGSEIESLINDNQGVLVAESPTGTGKTLAYLVPVVSSDKTAIISTATRHLQDQVFYKDLPLVLKALGIKKRSCLLKGRSNYLCLHRLHTHASVQAARNAAYDKTYQTICQWSNQTPTGDVNDLQVLEETSQLRPLITSTTDNCLGSECTHFNDCFVRKARLKALEADIVVVNHHLFLANMVLKDDGLGQLLPRADILVFDEAHSLPEIASTQLSRSVTSRQMTQLAGDLKSALLEMPEGVDELFACYEALEKQLVSILKRFTKPLKSEAQEFFDDHKTRGAFQTLLDILDQLSQLLKARSDHKEYDLLFLRANHCSELLGECLYNEHEREKYFCWIETGKRYFRVNQTPVELEQFGTKLSQSDSGSSVLVSATLSSAGDFSYFCEQLAITDATTHSWPSPFDYKKQCRLYIPEDLPEPRHPEYASALLEYAVKLINLFGGRLFFLFTSHHAMETMYPLLRARIDYPILKQGQMPKHDLIDKFKALGNGVLLGTSSFWEGVDVKGSTLSCVIIDKLPFASPDDPVLKARMKRMAEAGRNPFMHYQIPQMVIALKQGIGRLIRDENDQGVVMIGDSRLHTKRYGIKVLRALPAIPQTTRWAEVEQFQRTCR